MAVYKQSTSYTRLFKMISSSDHLSLKTAASPICQISKAGSAFGTSGSSVIEIANGWYKVPLTTTDTNTLGDLAFYITGTGADDTDFTDQVWGIDPSLSQVNASVVSAVTVGTNNDKTGYQASVVGQVNASVVSQVNASVVSAVTVGTNNDKTGYQASVVGQVNASVVSAVTIGTNNDKTGYQASVVGQVNASVVSQVNASVVSAVTVGTNNDKTGYALTSAEENAIADAILGRNVAGGSSTGRLVKEAFFVLRNKVDVQSSTLSVYQTDDSTIAWSALVSTAAQNPITTIDPA